MPRLPADAFERFLALGPSRSYRALAGEIGCSKRSVTARASKEGWQARLQRIDAAAAQKFDEKAANESSVVNERHLRVVRAIQHKALQALQALPLATGMDAVRALDLAVKAERTILGQHDGAVGIVLNVVTGTPACVGEPGQPPREIVERDDLPAMPVVRRLLERGAEG